MKIFKVFRLASLPEDEGRQHYLGDIEAPNKRAAMDKVEEKHCADGFYKRGDFKVLEDK